MPTEVTRAQRPSRITFGTQAIVAFFEVNGEATELSASDKEMPAWAACIHTKKRNIFFCSVEISCFFEMNANIDLP